MDKKLLKEIHRIHVLTYGEKSLNEQNLINSIFGGKKTDDPKKADMVSNDVDQLYKNIEDAINSGGLTQQKKGNMNYQKSVESMQIGLILLGYELPRFGVDGLFGPETASAVLKFKVDNIGEKNPNSDANPEMLKKLLELLKSKNIKPEELKKYTDTTIKSGGNINLTGDWIERTIQLLRKHEGFLPYAKWDENAFRGGYGSDKKLVNGKLVKVTKDTTWTKDEADKTLDYEIRNSYAPPIIKQLGNDNWEKLNDNQKAALVSLGYNAGPYFLTKRDYGLKIKKAIEDGDMETAAYYIQRGPTTGSSSGQYYAGLERRRKEESGTFLS
jgi:GH24 family phage-related lysozyme (muramidase)